MIPKFRAYAKRLDRTMEVTVIDFENQEVELLVARDGGLTSAICVPFDDIELMQSTGLFDKNGVEVFEGDMVAHTEEDMAAIVHMHPVLGMGLEVEEEIEWADIDLEELEEFKEESEKHYEVIGNIYENPELVSHA